MKLKFNYFAQQFLSHFLVVLVALLTLTFLFGHFIERFVYDNQTEELISYGQAILNDVETTNRNISPVLTAYRHVLNSQDIQYSLFDERSAITYSTNLRAASIELNEQEWQHLRNGRAITVKQEYERFGQAVTYVLLPHFQQQHFVGGILLTSPIQESKQVIAQMNEYVFITLLITLMIALLISGFLSKILGNRIKKLRTATATVAQGNYTVRLPIKQRDELGELAQDFNTMVKQLQQSHEEIEALEKRRRQFIADVSHELRTPLTTIRGVIEGLMTHLISEKEKQRGLELASKETRRLLRLVNENLDYEKIRSNQVHLVKQPIQLIELFSIIKEQLQDMAQERNNKFVIATDAHQIAYADDDRLTQILMNITKNSIQFTKNGTITLSAYTEAQQTVIQIQDTGIGMNPEEIENIWKRFYKAIDSRTTNPYGEFGLGLSIVKQLVLLHDGTITVDSQKGQGTTFTIRLPLQDKNCE